MRQSYPYCFLATLLVAIFAYSVEGAGAEIAFKVRPCEGGAEILGFNGAFSDENLVIPKTVDLHDGDKETQSPVVKIGDAAFERCEKIVSIEFPGTLKEIGDQAFCLCKSLKTVVFPENLTSIGHQAFAYCESLDSIELSDALTTLGFGAFTGCRSLSSVKLPKNLSEIPQLSFAQCESLNFVDLPANLTSIGDLAFSRCGSLDSISLPEPLIKLGEGAFLGCESLNSIALPKNLAHIGAGAFSRCDQLENIAVADENPNFQMIDNVLFSKDGKTLVLYLPRNGENTEAQKAAEFTKIGKNVIVARPKGELEYVVPQGVVEIGEGAFYGTIALKAIELPVGLEKIGDLAFVGCSSLTSIKLPEGLKEIGRSAFASCNSLNTIVPPSSGLKKIGPLAFVSCASLKSITLPDGLVEIGYLAFWRDASLKSINLPKTLEKLESGIFNGCDSLEKVDLDENNPYYQMVDDIIFTQDGKTLVYYLPYKKNEEYVVPDSVEKMESRAFSYNKSLKTIVLPEGLTEIKGNAFEGCASLSKVATPSTLKIIDSNAFMDCKALESVTLPEGLTEIRDSAFSGCSSLTTITIPEGIAELSSGLFAQDESLKSVVLPSTITKIQPQAFRSCVSLKTINFPDGLTEIGSYAFVECQSLETIELPEGLTTIGNGAFQYCDSLEYVKTPSSLTHIGLKAFPETTALSNDMEVEKPSETSLFNYVNPSTPQEGLTDFEQYIFAGITRLARELERGNSLSSLSNSRIFGFAYHLKENPYCPKPEFSRAPWLMNFELDYNDLRSPFASDLTIIFNGMVVTLSKKYGVCSGTMRFRCGYDYDMIGRFVFHPNGMLQSLQYTRVKYLGYALMSSSDLYKYGENLRSHFNAFVEALNNSILSGIESKEIFTRGIDTKKYPSKRVLWDDQGKIIEYNRSVNALEYDFAILRGDPFEINPFHNSRNIPNNPRYPLSMETVFEPNEQFDVLPTVVIPTENLNEHDRRKAELITQLTRSVSESKTLKELKTKLDEFPFVELFEANPATTNAKQPYTLAFNFLGNTEKSPCEFRYESPIGRFSICISFSAPNSKPDDYVLVEVLNADGASGCSVNALMSGVATDMFFHSGKEPLIAPLVFRRITGASDEDWEEYQKGFAPLYKMYEDSFATLGLNDVKVNYINNVQEVTRVVKHVKWNDSGEYLGQISWNRPITYQPQTGWLFKEKTPRFFNPDVVGYQCRVKATNSFNVYYGEGKAIVFGANSEEPIVSASSDAVPIDVDAVNPNASIETLPGEPNRFFTTSAD